MKPEEGAQAVLGRWPPWVLGRGGSTRGADATARRQGAAGSQDRPTQGQTLMAGQDLPRVRTSAASAVGEPRTGLLGTAGALPGNGDGRGDAFGLKGQDERAETVHPLLWPDCLALVPPGIQMENFLRALCRRVSRSQVTAGGHLARAVPAG